jgi:hypothetical protein
VEKMNDKLSVVGKLFVQLGVMYLSIVILTFMLVYLIFFTFELGGNTSAPEEYVFFVFLNSTMMIIPVFITFKLTSKLSLFKRFRDSYLSIMFSSFLFSILSIIDEPPSFLFEHLPIAFQQNLLIFSGIFVQLIVFIPMLLISGVIYVFIENKMKLLLTRL